jgi:hypothetical protein
VGEETGAFYVMDRGYIDFQRLYRLHQAGSFFVTRAVEGERSLPEVNSCFLSRLVVENDAPVRLARTYVLLLRVGSVPTPQ